ncbi:hypothetical protein HEP_00512700, partial [Hepatocystis sp. ex Piliocolobus tephrosceles]
MFYIHNKTVFSNIKKKSILLKLKKNEFNFFICTYVKSNVCIGKNYVSNEITNKEIEIYNNILNFINVGKSLIKTLNNCFSKILGQNKKNLLNNSSINVVNNYKNWNSNNFSKHRIIVKNENKHIDQVVRIQLTDIKINKKHLYKKKITNICCFLKNYRYIHILQSEKLNLLHGN